MARFASFTTPAGQQDSSPTGGMTLAALMARQKQLTDLQASQASGSYPGQGTLTGGIGHMLNMYFTGAAENRAQQQEAAGRQRLAEIMRGINPETGATEQQIADMSLIDPEASQRAQEALAQIIRDRKAQEFTAGQTKETQAFTHGEGEATRAASAAEAEKTRQAQIALETQRETADAKAAALKREQELQDPTTASGKVMRDFNAGIYGDPSTPEAQQRRDQEIQKATYIAPVNPALRFTPGQAEADKKFATDALDWKQSGGPNVQKTATQLGMAIDILGKPGVIGPSGTLVGLGNQVLPDVAMKWLNPDGTIARDAVRESVQQTLRQTLGAQFTEKEGTDLMNRAFDPALKPEENIRRAKLILAQVGGIAQQKQAMVDYFDKNGTLVGYQGPQIDTSALTNLFVDPNHPGGGGGGGAGATTGNPAVDDLVKKYTQ